MRSDPFDPQDVEFLVSRLIDGDLEEGARRTLEAQLAQDSEVQSVQRDFDRLDQALKSLPAVPETHWKQFESRVLAGCRQVQRESSRRRIYRWAGGMLAAAAAVAMVTTVVLQTRTSNPGSMVVAEVTLGPKAGTVVVSAGKAPRAKFSFARGGQSLPQMPVEDSPRPSSGTLIVACATPMSGNGMNWADLAF